MSKSKISKNTKLIISVVCDAIGMLSYAIPGAGEVLDAVWAPIAGMTMFTMYGGTKGAMGGVFVAIEEAAPGIGDWIPSFTLMWLFTYVWNKDEESVEDIKHQELETK